MCLGSFFFFSWEVVQRVVYCRPALKQREIEGNDRRRFSVCVQHILSRLSIDDLYYCCCFRGSLVLSLERKRLHVNSP